MEQKEAKKYVKKRFIFFLSFVTSKANLYKPLLKQLLLMSTITVKGNEFQMLVIRDSFQRRAVQFKNNIIATLRKIDLTEDDIDIEIEAVAIKRAPASASWYFNGHYLHYSYQASRFIDNLYIVSRVIELSVDALLQGKITVDDFVREFAEDKDVTQQRIEARELLGVPPNSTDMKLIDKNYKELAKKYHPDTSQGDTEKFKAINRAHKMLKRELE